jgi:hypothetical protein
MSRPFSYANGEKEHYIADMTEVVDRAEVHGYPASIFDPLDADADLSFYTWQHTRQNIRERAEAMGLPPIVIVALLEA